MKRVVLVTLLSGMCGTAFASGDLDRINTLTQPEFRQLAEDLGAVVGYKALTPAEPLGITGFDVGVEASFTSMQHGAVVDKASSGSGYSTMPATKLHLHKGLPLGLDVGLVYGVVPGSNLTMTGGELRYALVEGGVATPAVGLRASYSQSGGVDQLALTTRGLELTVSKGFAMVTPYIGGGQVWVNATPHNSAGLREERFAESRLYVGANFNFGLMNLVLEGDRTGNDNSYSAKIGLRF